MTKCYFFYLLFCVLFNFYSCVAVAQDTVKTANKKLKKYYNVTEEGILIGKYRTNKVANFSLSTINGYVINPRAAVGLGLSCNFYEQYLLGNFFADFRGDVLYKKIITPYYYAHLGTGFIVSKLDATNNNLKTKNYPNYQLGVGLKIKKYEKVGWNISFGYSHQKIKEKYSFLPDYAYEKVATFNRFIILTGINF